MSKRRPSIKSAEPEINLAPSLTPQAVYLEDGPDGDGAAREAVVLQLAPKEPPLGVPALSEGAEGAAGRFMEDCLEDAPGMVVGRYQLLEALGEGGCGTVYRAEQRTPVQRLVALKLIREGMDTADLVRRFEAECQALARMDHPHIVQVLDAGATRGGRRFFVMELIQGPPITEFCDRGGLTIEARIRLFLPVCQAIQHVHSRGIVHRDIKPGNVLVTMQDGQPMAKVIDFGIADAIALEPAGLAAVGGLPPPTGTPAYMSPEQAGGGGAAQAASDVYSLGAMLYELLTGRPPFSARDGAAPGLEELARRIREDAAVAPSRLVSELPIRTRALVALERRSDPPRLARRLRGDLDCIVLKALAKDPALRYRTAQALAADLQRHLDHEPVEARPARPGYRLGRLVRRHRPTVMAAVTAALVLALGMAILHSEHDRADHAEELSQRMGRIASVAHAALHRQAQSDERQREIQARMAEAGRLASGGRRAEATRLLDQLPLVEIPRNSGFDAMRRSLGDGFAAAGRWSEAADNFDALLRWEDFQDPERWTQDYLRLTGALAAGGDRIGYRQLQATALERLGATSDPSIAGRLARGAMLIADNPTTMHGAMDALYEVLRWDQRSGQVGPEARQSGAIALALIDCRRQQWDRSAQWCVLVLNQGLRRRPTDDDDVEALVAYIQWRQRRATLHVILALDDYQRGLTDPARTQLAMGRRTIVHAIPPAGTAGDQTYRNMWHDWIFADVLLHEAERLIGAPAIDERASAPTWTPWRSALPGPIASRVSARTPAWQSRWPGFLTSY